MLPKNSQATIHTDSQVAIEVLKKKYDVMFHPFNREYLKTSMSECETLRKLQISLSESERSLRP